MLRVASWGDGGTGEEEGDEGEGEGEGAIEGEGRGLLTDYEPQDFDIHKPTLQITEGFRQRPQ